MSEKNNLFLARLKKLTITSWLQVIFPEISGKFPETLNLRKINNPSCQTRSEKYIIVNCNVHVLIY